MLSGRNPRHRLNESHNCLKCRPVVPSLLGLLLVIASRPFCCGGYVVHWFNKETGKKTLEIDEVCESSSLILRLSSKLCISGSEAQKKDLD